MSPGHVVLVGAGHANLTVVRGAARLRRAGLAVTLVDPDAFWYSGMAAAMLGGAVPPARCRIDAEAAARARGVRFVRGRVVAMDLVRRRVVVDDGTVLDATAVVLNVGSDPAANGLSTGRDDVVAAKPISELRSVRDRLLAGPRRPRVVIVGGGATAVEFAGNLSAGPVAEAVRPHVAVVAGDDPLAAVDAAVRARVLAPLTARGVAWEPGVRAVDITDRGVHLDDGRCLASDLVLLATGLQASGTVAALGVGGPDGMPVSPTLQHPDHPWLFGAGDGIAFGPGTLPRLGVFAVRQAPVLLDNLLALHAGDDLGVFAPPQQYVAAIDLGGGDAVMMRAGRWFGGRAALVCKRLLDEWYLRRHRAPSWRPTVRR